MATYDKTDLLSTLNYIKSEYGTACFKDGKVIAFLSDLAPSLKREKSLLKKLVDKGLMKEIVENASADEITQRRIIFKTRSFLEDDELIHPDAVEHHISILAKAFNYKVSLQQKSQESKTNSTLEFKSDETVKCSVCGYDNPKNNKFCGSCGNKILVKLNTKCKICGYDNPEGNKFCGSCGIALLSEDSNVFQSFLDSLKSDIGLEMVACPAGSFMIGSLKAIYKLPKGSLNAFLGIEVLRNGELGRSYDEIQHNVTISKPFYLGKYPVTQKLYEAVMGNNPSDCKGKNNPVECISWNDAKSFCDKLNKKFALQLPKGYRFDLPTEAQWEYACRAGTTTALNNGKDLTSETGSFSNLDEVAWYDKNSDSKTHPVGQKKPNAWGIYDMHGNVWEWCRDWYGDYPKGHVADPVGPSTDSDRVSRGGSWCNSARFCRSANRYYTYPDRRNDFLGFRLVLVPNS